MSIGTDIVKIERVKKLLEHPQFLDRCFTPKEREYLSQWQKDREVRVAGLYAAKEAISKVFGTGIGKLAWKDMEVLHDSKGQPEVRLYGYAKELLEKRGFTKVVLSISHER